MEGRKEKLRKEGMERERKMERGRERGRWKERGKVAMYAADKSC